MIFDRTQNDVDTAILLRNTKVKEFETLTESEIATLEKGTLTINTLNRIETKQEELKNLFKEMGYFGAFITTKAWNETQIFNIDEFERIINNLSELKKVFFVYKDTPEIPSAIYHFNNLNSLEKILYDMDVMINDVKSHYKECGNFECGEG